MAIWFNRAILAGLVVCVTAGTAAAASDGAVPKADATDPWSWWQAPLKPDAADPWSDGRSLLTPSRPRAKLDRSDPWEAEPPAPPAPAAQNRSPSPQDEVKASLKQAIDAGDLDRAADLLKKLRSMSKPR